MFKRGGQTWFVFTQGYDAMRGSIVCSANGTVDVHGKARSNELKASSDRNVFGRGWNQHPPFSMLGSTGMLILDLGDKQVNRNPLESYTK